jgi:hypothetical protein
MKHRGRVGFGDSNASRRSKQTSPRVHSFRPANALLSVFFGSARILPNAEIPTGSARITEGTEHMHITRKKTIEHFSTFRVRLDRINGLATTAPPNRLWGCVPVYHDRRYYHAGSLGSLPRLPQPKVESR